MPLKSLEEYNKEKLDKYLKKDHRKNGIACPNCGEELYDSQPNCILTSMPPQIQIACTNCNYVGTRIL